MLREEKSARIELIRVRKLAPLVAALAASMVAGCGRADDGSFTLATKIAFFASPVKGAFTVSDGSDALGCLRGTFVDKRAPRFPGGMAREVFSCTKGDRTGSFTIRFLLLRPPLSGKTEPVEIDETGFLETVTGTFEATWRFESGTGDFTGLHGNGDYSVETDANNFKGAGTLTGKVRY
jgi:hypothetical protein